MNCEKLLDRSDDRAFEFCQLEIGIIQDNIARFDANGLQIKTWCTSTWTAVQAYAIANQLTRLAISGAVVSLIFAVLELPYRRFQYRFIQRSKEIERILASDIVEKYEYLVYVTAVTSNGKAEVTTSLRQTHFYMLYLLLATLSLLIWWWL